MMQFDLVDVLPGPLEIIGCCAPWRWSSISTAVYFSLLNLSIYRGVSRTFGFFFSSRPQLSAISIRTSAIIKNEGATSLSLFSAPLCLFSVAGVRKARISYFQAASPGHGPCSLQFFLCLEQGLLTHSAELDGWIGWSQRFWQRITHPSRLALNYSQVWGHFSSVVFCSCTWCDLGTVRVIKLHMEGFSSCIVYLKKKNRWLFCVFSLVQMFCNKTMMKHRTVQRMTTSPVGGHLLFFLIWDGEC